MQIAGFQASDIGQYGIEDFSWGLNSGSYSLAPGRFGPPIGAGTSSPFFDNPILDALGQIIAAWAGPASYQQRASVPAPRARVVWTQTGGPVDENPRAAPVVQEEEEGTYVLDPSFRPEFVVYEDAPGGIYETNRQPTDWDAYYREYVKLNPPVEEEPVFDWITSGVTDLANLGSTVGWWGNQNQEVFSSPTGGYPSMAPGSASQIPAKVTVDTRTGKVTKCKRRRRRKLLTESDFNVLLRVATLPSKENVRIVLGKAIGRS